jgi:hypothetical protein
LALPVWFRAIVNADHLPGYLNSHIADHGAFFTQTLSSAGTLIEFTRARMLAPLGKKSTSASALYSLIRVASFILSSQ